MKKILLVGLTALLLSSCDILNDPYLINNYSTSIKLTIIQDAKQTDLILKPCQSILISHHKAQDYNNSTQIVIKTNENEKILSLTRKQLNALISEYGSKTTWSISEDGLIITKSVSTVCCKALSLR